MITACGNSSGAGRPIIPRRMPTPASRVHSRKWQGTIRMRTVRSENRRRIIQARRVATALRGLIFAALCDGPRGKADYIELAHRYQAIFVPASPGLPSAIATNGGASSGLIDEFYDRRVKLIASAAAAPGELYPEGMAAGDLAAPPAA